MTMNNRRRWSPARVADLRRMIEVEGLTTQEAADRLKVTRSAVCGQMDRKRIQSSNMARSVLRRSLTSDTPPSPAALRLAQFDPIVRRAVDERMGVVADRESD